MESSGRRTTDGYLWMAAYKALSRHRRTLNRLPNVVAVGIGRKFVRGRPTMSPCVTVVVAKKWKTRGPASTRIPEFLSVRITFRGHASTESVLTDVRVVRRGRIHSSIGARACSANAAGSTVGGAACCVVTQGTSGGMFVLGCHHVFALSEVRGPLTPAEFSAARVSVSGLSLPLQELAILGRCDAAIAALGAGASDGGRVLRGDTSVPIVAVAKRALDVPHSYEILARGRVIPVTADFLGPAEVTGYFNPSTGGKRALTYPEVLISRSVSSETPVPGDSGAPIVSSGGVFLGMHIAGSGRFSFAIPSWYLVRAFSPQIQVVKS